MTSTKQITKKGFICIFRTCVFFPPRSLFIGPSVVLVLLTLAHSLNTRRFQSRILPPLTQSAALSSSHLARSIKSPSPINLFLSPFEPRPCNSSRCLVIIRYYTGLYGIFSSRRGSFRFNQGGWGYTGPLCVMYIIYRCSPFQWMLSTL